MNTLNAVIDKAPSGWIFVSGWSGSNQNELDPAPMNQLQRQLQKFADLDVGCMMLGGLKPISCP